MFGKKITEAEVMSIVNREVLDLKLEIEKLKTHINSLRGLINRSKRKDLDDEEPQNAYDEPKKENNKSDVLVKI